MQHSRNDADIKINVNEKSKDTTTNKHENNQEKPATKSEVIVESQRKRHPMTYAAAITKKKHLKHINSRTPTSSIVSKKT